MTGSGQMMGRGVVKEQRRIRGDVLNSTSPLHLSRRLSRCLAHSPAAFHEDRGDMNLYKSFGNLMEAWVSDGDLCLEPEWVRNNDEDLPTPSSDVGTNLRSESVDSGVETASSVTSFPPTPCSISTDNAEMEAFTPEREGLTPASTSQSPVLSSPVPSPPPSSSPQLLPRRPQEDSTALHLKVEQALQKTDSLRQKKKTEPLTVEEVLRRRPRAPFLPKRHTSELVRGQRSESFILRRTDHPSVLLRQMSDTCRRPMSMGADMQLAQMRSEDLGEEARTGMSPGLRYLEDMCQMLEKIAREQMHSRVLQMEMDTLQEHEDMEVSQAPDTCQGDSDAAEEDLTSCQSLGNTESEEQTSSVPQQRKEFHYGHFRKRSASDTNLSKMHLRNLDADCRGQHMSTTDLMEEVEEEYEKQESGKEATHKKNKNWRLKFGSWSKQDSGLRDEKGQQMQSFERNSARRRLSQLFKWRRKTQPV
ncbi:uncharacterized protein si:dkey-106l3.7 isoform X3 [Epinephelus fuscoguttatus]|uniref:uncharacterized protein si:dkey-106l3.7 isoform X3 n=1 Tax=Epinephelus fuscoguttatus TaxID=293821 RepID=UPI0020D1DC11|nr:uncharacterized protein si:dkey-106l3.7 isoform X3 [Epinephelus fuscoguttatus]